MVIHIINRAAAYSGAVVISDNGHSYQLAMDGSGFVDEVDRKYFLAHGFSVLQKSGWPQVFDKVYPLSTIVDSVQAIAHGLHARPFLTLFELVCMAPEGGYAA